MQMLQWFFRDRFKSIVRSFYRNAAAIILVYSVNEFIIIVNLLVGTAFNN